VSLIAFEGNRSGDMRKALQDALECIDECDGVVVLMQRKSGGVRWFAPDNMQLQTMIFLCHMAVQMLTNIALGIRMI
jgi:hypothetical protein